MIFLRGGITGAVQAMIKAFLTSLVIGAVFIVIYATDLFRWLSLELVSYLSFALVGIMLIVAVFILGLPEPKDQNNDTKEM